MDPQVYIDNELAQLDSLAKSYRDRGWRLTNICGSSVGDSVELLYSFSAGAELVNHRFMVENNQTVTAISPLYPNAFIFENEARDLYGVEFVGGIFDFGGRFYSPSVPTPMNPASLAAQEYLKTTTTSQDANTGEEVCRG